MTARHSPRSLNEAFRREAHNGQSDDWSWGPPSPTDVTAASDGPAAIRATDQGDTKRFGAFRGRP
jgi:hypothetical protein